MFAYQLFAYEILLAYRILQNNNNNVCEFCLIYLWLIPPNCITTIFCLLMSKDNVSCVQQNCKFDFWGIFTPNTSYSLFALPFKSITLFTNCIVYWQLLFITFEVPTYHPGLADAAGRLSHLVKVPEALDRPWPIKCHSDLSNSPQHCPAITSRTADSKRQMHHYSAVRSKFHSKITLVPL